MKPAAVEAKKLKAMEAQAEGLARVTIELAEVNRKLDQVLELLTGGEAKADEPKELEETKETEAPQEPEKPKGNRRS